MVNRCSSVYCITGSSGLLCVFGMPQGIIFGPLLFNWLAIMLAKNDDYAFYQMFKKTH